MQGSKRRKHPEALGRRISRREFVGQTAALAASTLLLPMISIRSASATASGIDSVLSTAVDQQDVPFAVGMVGNASGVTHTGAFGESAPGVAASPETLFRIFSMSKAVGSTAGMILIDRGQLAFDTPVEEIYPDFADLQILERFDGDTPILRPQKRKVTIRHLSTHTSGLVYPVWNAKMNKYVEVANHPSVLTGLRKYLYSPMVFDAGDRWDYGIGVDWVGQVVEKIDGRRIDKFCQEEIFDPLGMPDTMFEVRADAAARLCQASARQADGSFAPTEIAPPSNPEVYGMGHALYSTTPDYMRFLRMFLNKGELDGNRVLSEAGVESMLRNHIGDVRVEKMTTLVPEISADVNLFPGTPKTHSFGFLRTEANVPGMRSAGSQGWAGVCNTHFWFDPSKDVAGIIMTQSLPFVEPRFMQTYANFEKAVYSS